MRSFTSTTSRSCASRSRGGSIKQTYLAGARYSAFGDAPKNKAGDQSIRRFFRNEQTDAPAALFFARRQIGAGSVCDFGGQPNRFAERWVRVDGFADVGGVAAHFDGKGDFANHVAG